MMWIVPKIMAVLTRHPRQQVFVGVDFEWSYFWTHNIFRVYELIFGRRYGIKAEMSSFVDSEGNTGQIAHSWEASCALIETMIREALRFRFPVRIWVPMLSTPQGPMFASPYVFAVAFDATSATSRTANATNTVSHTCTGSDLIFISGSTIDNTDQSHPTITAISYNSIAFTGGGSGNLLANDTGAGEPGRQFLYYLYAPATGAHTFSATQNTAATYGFVSMNCSYSGVSQTGFPDASSTPVTYSSSVNLTMSVTVVANGSWALFYNSNSTSDSTAGTNTTQRQNGTTTGPFLGDSNGPLSPGSFSMTVNHTSTTWSGLMISFAPVNLTPAVLTADISLIGYLI